MITLYQYEISPFCDKVRRVLHLKRQPYTVREVSLMETGRGLLKKLSPAARLPVLEEGGNRVADSTDIVRYLEDRFPEPAVYPSDPRERALAHVLEDWADESLYFYEMYLRFGLAHNAKRWSPVLAHADGGLMKALAPRVVPMSVKRKLKQQGLGGKPLDVILNDVENHVASIAGMLEGRDWLVSDRISIADVAVFAQLDCISGADEGDRICDAHPSVRAWMERVENATAPTAS